MLKTLTFSKEETCDLMFQKDLFSADRFLASLTAESYVIILDKNLHKYYGKKLKETFLHKKASFLIVPATEKSKSFSQINKLLEKLFLLGCTRQTTLIAFGGGVILDLVGFLASIFLRGVNVVYIPTTIIAMVDASIGGKTGINTTFGKNLIGAFSQPKAIYFDPLFLETLPKKYLREGLSEMVKHALIADRKLFDIFFTNSSKLKNLELLFIENHLMLALSIKKTIVQLDPLDKGRRQLLNFGHTIAHGLESALGHKITHGKAVCVGMVIESYISYEKKILAKASFEKILQAIFSFGLHFSIKINLDKRRFFQALLYDKKNLNNQVHIVLLKDIGECLEQDGKYSFPISKQELEKAFVFMNERFLC